MQTESLDAPPVVQGDTSNAVSLKDDAKPVYFGWRDMIFIVAALVVAITVARLGLSTWTDGNRTEAVKARVKPLRAGWQNRASTGSPDKPAMSLRAISPTRTGRSAGMR